MKNTLPIFLILAAVGIFFGYIKPGFGATESRRADLRIYNTTLDQAKQLEKSINDIEAKINAISPEDMNDLNKFLPKSISNVNLIIDIDNIARDKNIPGIRNIEIEEPDSKEEKSSSKRDDALYNSIDLSFNVSSSYQNFLAFIESLEGSLRLVDITSITFTPTDTSVYDYKVTLRTYWLK